MTARGLIGVPAAVLVAVCGTWGMAGEKDEPLRLRDKVVLNKRGIVSRDYITFSPDGTRLLTLNRWQHKAHLWDVVDEKHSAVLSHIGTRISAAVYSPDGKTIATAPARGEIWLWDAKTAKIIRSFAAVKGINQLMYSADGKTLSATALGELYVYNVKEGRLLRSCKIDPGKHYYSLRPVACSRVLKEPMVACGGHLYNAVTGDVCYELYHEEKYRGGSGLVLSPYTAITPDEKKMARIVYGSVLLWDNNAENKDPDRRKCLAYRNPRIVNHCLAFSPNDKILAVGYAFQDNPTRGGVLIFDAASGKLLYNQDARVSAVYSLAFSPLGGLLVTGDSDFDLKLWEVPAAWSKNAK